MLLILGAAFMASLFTVWLVLRAAGLPGPSAPAPTTTITTTTTIPPTIFDEGAYVVAGSTTTTAPATRVLHASAYCLTTPMANGQLTFIGAAASNLFPIGTRLEVLELEREVIVLDRSAEGATDLDIAMPGDCDRASAFGRPYLHVRVTSPAGGGSRE